jgi:antibiotic biosynthesis monooxygenase (ABM) superfamily enzyme
MPASHAVHRTEAGRINYEAILIKNKRGVKYQAQSNKVAATLAAWLTSPSENRWAPGAAKILYTFRGKSRNNGARSGTPAVAPTTAEHQ